MSEMTAMHAEGTVASPPSTSALVNGKTSSEEIGVEIPKVVIDDPEESTGFASSVVKVLSMQKFYTKSVRKSRESWLQKYTYHRANEEREWRRPLMRKSPSPSPQPESPASDQNTTAMSSSNEEQESLEELADFQRSCCMPMVLEPSGVVYFCWLVIVSLAVMYNYYAIILFVAFPSIYTENYKVCFGIDYTFDSIFVLDLLVQFRTGFLQDGILEYRSKKLAKNYVRSLGFLLDVVAVIPFDLLYFVLGLYPILRVNRLLKVQRFFLFCDRGEIYSGRPKLFNLLKLILYLLLIIHWVACLYFLLSRFEGFGQDEWIHPKLEGKWAEVGMQYLYSLHRSSVIMTTVGTITVPRTNLTMIFGCVTYLCGVLIFATIVGNAGDMIVDMRRSRELYLRKLNGMKEYVTAHQLSAHLKKRVIQWFDYMWTHKRDMDEDQLFANLNDNFRAEIAIHVNLETLIKVEMFKVCDPGFLNDLVLKLKPMICSPGDFICRQGEKGREMYIVNKGSVEVLDEKETILATLKAGSHFGEISLLNMKGIGDRRTASVRSVGFTDLFRLSKDDLEEVLEFYPDEKHHMEKIATKTYERQQKERMRSNLDADTADTDVPKDPRKWLAADTATLRRRLSWIEAVNNLKRFASGVKKGQCQDDEKSSREILKEYSEKARRLRSDDEARQIIQDFVTEIHAREATQSSKPSIVSEDSFFMSNPSGRIISREMNDSLIRHRIMTKRSSYSLAENTNIVWSVGSYSTVFRQRSKTMTPFTFENPRDLLNFQTLETTPMESAVKYGTFNVTMPKPNSGILKKKSTFGDSNPTNAKESKQNSSFVVSKEPLVTMQFKNMVRTTMEKRRKWFEGDMPTNNKNPQVNERHLYTEPFQNIEENLASSCADGSMFQPITYNEDPSPSTHTTSMDFIPVGNMSVWERQHKDITRFKRPSHSKHIMNVTATQAQKGNPTVSKMDRKLERNAPDEKQTQASYSENDGCSIDSKATDKRQNNSTPAKDEEKQPMIESLHSNVECACSKIITPRSQRVQHNNNDKKTELEIETTSKTNEDKRKYDKQRHLEETYC